jgi:hypothetical protein
MSIHLLYRSLFTIHLVRPTRSMLLTLLLAGNSLLLQAEELTLDHSIKLALANDPWLVSNLARERALQAQSEAAASLPNPRLAISAMNLPTDSFRFSQEPMTQLSLGFSQMFPRGASLALRRQQLQQASAEQPLLRLERQADVTSTVSQLWLDAYKAQQSIQLIGANRALFEQLVQVASNSYASAMGRTRQQDIIRAQLELTTLDERLSRLDEQKRVALQRLEGWLTASDTQQLWGAITSSQLPDPLPALTPVMLAAVNTAQASPAANFNASLLGHPSILALDQRISAALTGEDLASQQYQPEWAVNASYSYRDDTPQGQQRADFASIGVSFDLPLLQRHQADASIKAATANIEAIKAERWLRLRQLQAALLAEQATIAGLSARVALYQQDLLPHLDQYAEATLTAYTNDEGEFVEVVRARISQLNARIDAMALAVDQRKALARLAYYLPATADTYATTHGQPARSGAQP